ncbi:serine hydrolase [Gordonia phage BrutonGaster]|uniref:Serine hydrolase n=1 Tax=Gordonia phage BrutonGaster TaxID=2530116 RepID=A0A482JHU6_9CAUD|nr:lysin B [Gordonia phage BrutonGaster]QBP33341.1 serine hydrolase [Gordonia phage BrutonGaster]
MRALAIILVVILTSCGINLAQAGDSVAGGCPTVQRYAIGGTGDPTSTQFHNPPYPRVNIQYPADVYRGDHSRRVAMYNLETEARIVRNHCPNTRIEVYGYSLGASAASLVIDRWQTDPVMNRNVRAYYYGNPRRPIDASGYGGIEAAGLPSIPGVYTWRGQRITGPIPVREFCGMDIICSSSAPIHRDLVHSWRALIGYLTTEHRY